MSCPGIFNFCFEKSLSGRRANSDSLNNKNCYNDFIPEFAELKDKLTSFHKRKWKNALILDWISQEKAKTLPLLEFYVGSKWKERRKALQNYEKELTSINHIVKVVDPNDPPRPVQIFIPIPIFNFSKITNL